MRNKQIDGLRGMTILLIVVYHIFCRYRELFFGDSVPVICYFGTFGNCVFLLISSYFLVGTTLAKYHLKDLVGYLKKKVIRLWPCYAVSITVTAIVLHIFYLPGRMSTWFDYFLNLIFINGYIGTAYVDAAHWYITTLLSAIILIGLIRWMGLEDKPWIYFLFMFLEGATKVLHLTPVNTLLCSSHIGIICLGICINKLKKNKWCLKNIYTASGLLEYWNKNKWLFLAIVSGLYYLVRRGGGAFVCTVLASILIVLALDLKLRVMDGKLPQFLGKISYPLYLIHQNIAYVIEYYLTQRYGYSISHGIIAIIIVSCCGILLYYCVERPVQLKIKK